MGLFSRLRDRFGSDTVAEPIDPTAPPIDPEGAMVHLAESELKPDAFIKIGDVDGEADGLDEVPTEMVSMDLTGDSEVGASSDGVPVEDFSLNFEEIKVTYTENDSADTGEPDSGLDDVVASPDEPLVEHPFIKFDGVDGESHSDPREHTGHKLDQEALAPADSESADHHEKWIDVLSMGSRVHEPGASSSAGGDDGASFVKINMDPGESQPEPAGKNFKVEVEGVVAPDGTCELDWKVDADPDENATGYVKFDGVDREPRSGVGGPDEVVVTPDENATGYVKFDGVDGESAS
jgi:hypothetical protein